MGPATEVLRDLPLVDGHCHFLLASAPADQSREASPRGDACDEERQGPEAARSKSTKIFK